MMRFDSDEWGVEKLLDCRRCDNFKWSRQRCGFWGRRGEISDGSRLLAYACQQWEARTNACGLSKGHSFMTVNGSANVSISNFWIALLYERAAYPGRRQTYWFRIGCVWVGTCEQCWVVVCSVSYETKWQSRASVPQIFLTGIFFGVFTQKSFLLELSGHQIMIPRNRGHSPNRSVHLQFPLYLPPSCTQKTKLHTPTLLV